MSWVAAKSVGSAPFSALWASTALLTRFSSTPTFEPDISGPAVWRFVEA